MMSEEDIATLMSERGFDMTPQEVRDTLHSIAERFRALDPSLPEDDDELIGLVIHLLRDGSQPTESEDTNNAE